LFKCVGVQERLSGVGRMQEKPSAAWAVLDPDPVVELSARGVIYGALESGPQGL